VRELRPGLWHWEAPHPGWEPTEPWTQSVSSYAIDDGERLLLFDPLGVPGELEDLAATRETAIVLTAPWHERDAQSLVERLGVPVYRPLPDTAQYLMDTYGITAEQAGDGSPDVVWLLREKKGEARRGCIRPATGCHSVPTYFPGTRRTTLCSGSRASVR
jgi:hypothetical protein